MDNKDLAEALEQKVKNLTDDELDNLLKDAMREQGIKRFINYKGEEEDL